MSHYKHFTTKEREKILFFLAQEKTISFIAKELQRDKSSVSREINTEGIYSPSYAQKQYEIRRRKCGRKPLLLNADIHKTVQFLFLQYQWSPEQISFRLKHEKNPIQISYATIYRGIYRGFLEEGKLSPGQRGVARKLRHKGKTRHKNGCIETRGKISHHISERPEQANQRERIGDWEADTVAGVTGKACLVMLVDRKSRYLLCEKVAKKDSISVKQAIIHMLKDSLILDYSENSTLVSDMNKDMIRKYFKSAPIHFRIQCMEELMDTYNKYTYASNALDYLEASLLKITSYSYEPKSNKFESEYDNNSNFEEEDNYETSYDDGSDNSDIIEKSSTFEEVINKFNNKVGGESERIITSIIYQREEDDV